MEEELVIQVEMIVIGIFNQVVSLERKRRIEVDKVDLIGLKWKTYALDKYWWLMALAWAQI